MLHADHGPSPRRLQRGLVNSAPEIEFLAVDSDDDLLEMPDIVAARRLALQAAGVG
jgi:hypothetical protein